MTGPDQAATIFVVMAVGITIATACSARLFATTLILLVLVLLRRLERAIAAVVGFSLHVQTSNRQAFAACWIVLEKEKHPPGRFQPA